MVRKIKNTAKGQEEVKLDGSQLNSKTYMKMLTEVNDVTKMNDFLNDIKLYEDEAIREMDLDQLLKMLPASVKDHFMSIISGAGIGKLNERQRTIFITQNYDMIKNMLVDMIISFKQETPETIQMEKEFTESFDKFQSEYDKVKEIQYGFCKVIRRQRIAQTEAIYKKTHEIKQKQSIERMLNIIKAIEDFSFIPTRMSKAEDQSKILQLCLNEVGTGALDHNTLLTLGAKATKLLLEDLMNAPEQYHDPREFTSIIYTKLFEPSEENMELVTYFWLGYTNAIVGREIGTAMRTFILETSINWVFLAKDEMPEEDINTMRENIIKVAQEVKDIITTKRAVKTYEVVGE